MTKGSKKFTFSVEFNDNAAIALVLIFFFLQMAACWVWAGPK